MRIDDGKEGPSLSRESGRGLQFMYSAIGIIGIKPVLVDRENIMSDRYICCKRSGRSKA